MKFLTWFGSSKKTVASDASSPPPPVDSATLRDEIVKIMRCLLAFEPAAIAEVEAELARTGAMLPHNRVATILEEIDRRKERLAKASAIIGVIQADTAPELAYYKALHADFT